LTGRVAGALAVLAALSGLTACGPAAKPVVALNYAGGRPTAVIVSCSGFKIDNIYVNDITTFSAKAKWSAQTKDHAGPAQITLLVAPPGWTVTADTLPAFEASGKYEVVPFANLADPATSVAFTVDQLKALKPGQVLVSKGNSKSVAVSEKKFRSDAADAC
jgi:hypothetical protein